MIDQYKIFGIDFTSKPSKKKPIVCIECHFRKNSLIFSDLHRWPTFKEFENALIQPGKWIMGIDFPFTQSEKFLTNMGWPNDWKKYVNKISKLSRSEFREILDGYRKERRFGDKEHKRNCDKLSGALSPQKIYGTPVGLMFYEGAARLNRSDLTIPFIKSGDINRIAIESYPSIITRKLIGRVPYKNESSKSDHFQLLSKRENIYKMITDDFLFSDYNFHVEAPIHLINDPFGDELDALLCAIQATWALRQLKSKKNVFKDGGNLSEGWIADPSLFS